MNTKHLSYNDLMHRYGRIFTVIGISIMFSIPISIWMISGVAPDFNKLVIAVASLSILYLPGGIVELTSYSPLLGTSATYLAFITGNLVNLKIPCVMNARQLIGTEIGTEENEVVSTIAVAFSTITTITVMGVGILMLTPLRPLLSSPVLQPAFNWVISALFGAMGYKYFKQNPKLIFIPLIFVSVLALLLPSFLQGNIAIVVVLCALVSVGGAKILYDKKWL